MLGLIDFDSEAGVKSQLSSKIAGVGTFADSTSEFAKSGLVFALACGLLPPKEVKSVYGFVDLPPLLVRCVRSSFFNLISEPVFFAELLPP